MDGERCRLRRCERADMKNALDVARAGAHRAQCRAVDCSSSEGDFSRSRSSTVLFTLVTVSTPFAAPLIGRVATLKLNPPAHDAQARSSKRFWSTVLVVYGSIPFRARSFFSYQSNRSRP